MICPPVTLFLATITAAALPDNALFYIPSAPSLSAYFSF